ncbi:MAG: PH domain-containing protein [Emergencia sp.]
MEFQKPDPRAVTGWRIARGITACISLLVCAAVTAAFLFSGWTSPWRNILMGFMAAWLIYCIAAMIIYPVIEYRQWGYIIEEDKVVIRHGIFFIREVIVPVIRIQNITLSQGPVSRKLGLYKLELSLASGSFEIAGLNRETAEAVSEHLKEKLYHRLREKGALQ